MKVEVYYEAVRTIVIDLDEKYRPLVQKIEGDYEYTDQEESVVSEMINSIDDYIAQIDPDFEQSTGMVGIDVNVDWEW